MDCLKFQGFLVQFGLLVVTLELPGANIGEVGVITLCLAIRHLVFDPEMAAA